MHDILRDDEVDREVSDGLNLVSEITAYTQSFWIFASTSQHSSRQLEGSKQSENYKIHKMKRWVRIIYNVPDVERYIQLELKDPRKSVAVTGKC